MDQENTLAQREYQACKVIYYCTHQTFHDIDGLTGSEMIGLVRAGEALGMARWFGEVGLVPSDLTNTECLEAEIEYLWNRAVQMSRKQVSDDIAAPLSELYEMIELLRVLIARNNYFGMKEGHLVSAAAHLERARTYLMEVK